LRLILQIGLMNQGNQIKNSTESGQFHAELVQIRPECGKFSTECGEFHAEFGQFRSDYNKFRADFPAFRTESGQFCNDFQQFRSIIFEIYSKINIAN
jgi:hypothetical protein